jgi:hypothetical protein
MPERKDGKRIVLEEEELISLVVLSSQETDDSKVRLISSISVWVLFLPGKVTCKDHRDISGFGFAE